MIDHLANLLEAFPGSANRTRCFTHILNLVTRCITKKFNAPKKKKTPNVDSSNDIDKDVDDLQGVLDNLEEELEEDGKDEGDSEWEFDIRIELTEGEIEE